MNWSGFALSAARRRYALLTTAWSFLTASESLGMLSLAGLCLFWDYQTTIDQNHAYDSQSLEADDANAELRNKGLTTVVVCTGWLCDVTLVQASRRCGQSFKAKKLREQINTPKHHCLGGPLTRSSSIPQGQRPQHQLVRVGVGARDPHPPGRATDPYPTHVTQPARCFPLAHAGLSQYGLFLRRHMCIK